MTVKTEAFSETVEQRPTVPRVDVELQHEIEQFLYHEANLLDEREFQDWLELFTDDIHYWMPTRYNRLRRE
ncbi:MAG: aromatic-ring-hydroxylating dioxygenase subunit beta, partial [Acidimicrobiia bacterium]